MKLPYKAGDWVAVPLRGEPGFAVGKIARVAPRGKIILCYFFGPPLSRVPRAEDLTALLPSRAVLVARCGDLGVLNGGWIVVESSLWIPDQWRMPTFGRKEPILGTTFKVTYAEDDPSRTLKERRASPTVVAKLPEDALFGSGAVEIRLTKILRGVVT